MMEFPSSSFPFPGISLGLVQRLAARSGCVRSIPVSMTQTVMDELPKTPARQTGSTTESLNVYCVGNWGSFGVALRALRKFPVMSSSQTSTAGLASNCWQAHCAYEAFTANTSMPKNGADETSVTPGTVKLASVTDRAVASERLLEGAPTVTVPGVYWTMMRVLDAGPGAGAAAGAPLGARCGPGYGARGPAQTEPASSMRTRGDILGSRRRPAALTGVVLFLGAT